MVLRESVDKSKCAKLNTRVRGRVMRIWMTDHVKGHCGWCGKKLEGRRSRWCSKPCRTEFKSIIRDQGMFREAVRARDGGVCCECGFQAEEMQQLINKTLRERWKVSGRNHLPMDQPELKGYPRSVVRKCEFVELKDGALHKRSYPQLKTLWQADHIHEVADGGFHDLDNAQTLCWRCHKDKTNKSAARRKRLRRVTRARKPRKR